MTAAAIVLNGEPHALPGPRSLAELVAELGLGGARIAVELNGQVVPRGQHGATQLRGGDRLEIIKAVGGG